MYSCPSDDIHSIYLDNELPLAYVKEYETHINQCPECAAKLNRLKTMHSLFQKDKESVSMDSQFMDQSFARLQTKMSYAKNTRVVHQFPAGEYAKLGIAAAAVIVAVVLPLKLIPSRSSSGNVNALSASVASIAPVERPGSTLISNKNIVINGNINDNLAQNVSTGSFTNPSFRDVDVFRPEFGSHEEWPLPPMYGPGPDFYRRHRQVSPRNYGDLNSEMMDMSLPVNTITGQLQ